MPRLSRWFVRTSLIYLVIGFTLGAALLVNKGLTIDPSIWNVLPIHTEVLLTGWLIQLALGVAFWILPRFTRGAPRGNERLIWAAYVLFNLGIVLAVAETIFGVHGLVLAGRISETAGVLVFVIGTWRRVRPWMPE